MMSKSRSEVPFLLFSCRVGTKAAKKVNITLRGSILPFLSSIQRTTFGLRYSIVWEQQRTDRISRVSPNFESCPKLFNRPAMMLFNDQDPTSRLSANNRRGLCFVCLRSPQFHHKMKKQRPPSVLACLSSLSMGLHHAYR